MNIINIGIIGSGQIGKSLAVLFSGLGLDVVLLSRNVEKTTKELAKLVKITTKLNKELNVDNEKIQIVDSFEFFSQSQLIIEAVSENINEKKVVLESLDQHISENTIVASTTSTKSITELANFISHKENFIGLHFFNPPTLINYLEVIKSEFTTENVVEEIVSFLESKERKYLLLNQENPGFIVNRALFLMLNEAIYELYEGLATAKDIDQAFKSGLNHPMGPIELCDFIGLDIVLDILNTLYEEYNDTKYRPCYLLKQKVRAGKLGKKTKEGFYKY